MILFCLAVLIGFALLAWSAERFVDGASSMARILGLPPMMIGLTIVSLGTSAPEIVVSAMAAIDGMPAMAVGNALGSNIANIGLVLGCTALLVPLAVRSQTVRREIPMLFLVMLLALGLMLDGNLGRADGFVLLAGLVALFWWMALIGRKGGQDALQDEFSKEIPAGLSMQASLLWFGGGLIILLLASRLVVWGAVGIAQFFGVSDLVIGLSIVAVGTSLPELSACVASAWKNEPDIAIGNVVGSNMVNMLAVLCMPALIVPHSLTSEVLGRDMPVMFGFTAAMFFTAYGFRGAGRIHRYEGFLLLAAYVAYVKLLFMHGS